VESCFAARRWEEEAGPSLPKAAEEACLPPEAELGGWSAEAGPGIRAIGTADAVVAQEVVVGLRKTERPDPARVGPIAEASEQLPAEADGAAAENELEEAVRSAVGAVQAGRRNWKEEEGLRSWH
jgi:hypothetical protein